MDEKRMLQGVIEAYENDFIGGYEGEDRAELQLIALKFILAVTRLANDYRYCSRIECACSPESNIRSLVERHGDELDKVFAGEHGLACVPMPKIREWYRRF